MVVDFVPSLPFFPQACSLFIFYNICSLVHTTSLLNKWERAIPEDAFPTPWAVTESSRFSFPLYKHTGKLLLLLALRQTSSKQIINPNPFPSPIISPPLDQPSEWTPPAATQVTAAARDELHLHNTRDTHTLPGTAPSVSKFIRPISAVSSKPSPYSISITQQTAHTPPEPFPSHQEPGWEQLRTLRTCGSQPGNSQAHGNTGPQRECTHWSIQSRISFHSFMLWKQNIKQALLREEKEEWKKKWI